MLNNRKRSNVQQHFCVCRGMYSKLLQKQINFLKIGFFPTRKKKKRLFAYLLGTDNDETVHHLGEHGAAWQDGGYHDTLLKILGVQSCQYRFW